MQEDMASLKLTELQIGKPAILADFAVSRLHQRLLSMGFFPGAAIRVMRRLPWRGNLYVNIDDRNIVLRFSEAALIGVTIP